MIKHAVLFACTLISVSSLAQSAINSAPATPEQTTTNLSGAGTETFNNQAGQSFSVDQLASQLQNLRTAVEQTLPPLAAFNQNHSNSANSDLGGTVSGLLSRATGHNPQTNTAPSQSSLTVSNLVGALANLLNTNHTGRTTVPQNTISDLVALQNSLQPVVTILDRLNVSSLSTNQFGTPNNNRLTPTGR